MRLLTYLLSLLPGSHRRRKVPHDEEQGTEMDNSDDQPSLSSDISLTPFADLAENFQFLRLALPLNPRHSQYRLWYLWFLKQHVLSVHDSFRALGNRDISHVHLRKEIFESMSIVLQLLRTEKNIPLAQMSDILSTRPLLRDAEFSNWDHLNLITFLLALITMLFEPSRAFLPRNLSEASAEANGESMPGGQSTGAALDYQSIATTPFKDVLRHLSRLHIPIHPRPQQQFLHTSSVLLANTTESFSLRAPNFHYSNLTKFARITVEWSPSMAQHLDFDAATKTLYLFKYPSFCALVCESMHGTSAFGESPSGFYLDRFLADYLSHDDRQNTDVATLTLSRPPQDVIGTSAALCHEILASYRLIFGQHRRSHRLAARKISFESLDDNDINNNTGITDPLLRTLCTSDWTKTPTVSFLGPVKTGYSPSRDFPMFSARLLALQDFVETQEPGGLTMLWYDRRDAMRFWTLWAVIGFGITAIVLGSAQVVIGIVQVVAQFEQTSS